MSIKRNIGKRTTFQKARKNILRGLMDGGTNKSGLSQMAFPDYNFQTPQGAAFAVSKIARQLEKDGLIECDFIDGSFLTFITKAGRNALIEMDAQLNDND